MSTFISQVSVSRRRAWDPRALRAALAAVMLALAAPLAAAATAVDDASFEPAVAALNASSFSEKAAAANALAALDHPRTVVVLQAMLDGALYQHRRHDRIVIAEDSPDGPSTVDAVTGESYGIAGRRDIARVTVNNALRRELRSLIARVQLHHDNARVRLAAVRELSRAIDGEGGALLREVRQSETDRRVLDAVDGALAMLDLASGDPARIRAAIPLLRGNVDARVRTALTSIRDDAAMDAALRRDAEQALNSIEQRMRLYRLMETVFFGLSAGSVLVLAAIGLAITFGVMRVINMAHGELIMLGAYTTYVVQLWMPSHINYSLFVAIPAAFLVAGLVGIAIERGVIRFLYGRPLETLLATFGISLILQQAVRSIFSPLNRRVSSPDWMSGSWEVTSGLAITYNRLYVIVFCLLVFAALVAVLKGTRLGLEVRAVSQNRAMARAMGVRSNWVDALTFGLGAGIAGVAGVALSQLTNVGPNLGQAYIIDSFLVVVFGGVGNLWGTLVSGMTLGVLNRFMEPYTGAVVAKILLLVFVILFIQKRPQGLFPQKGRAAEV